MVDELFDRGYQAGRPHLNAAIASLAHKLVEALGNPFRVLNRIEYQAPWTAQKNGAPCN